MQTQKFSMNTHDHQVISNHKSFVPGMFCTIQLGLHQFQILPILQVPSTKYYCLIHSQEQVPILIHGYTIECVVKINFGFVIIIILAITWSIMHKQQYWYLHNILNRFRYHQKMLVSVFLIRSYGVPNGTGGCFLAQ